MVQIFYHKKGQTSTVNNVFSLLFVAILFRRNFSISPGEIIRYPEWGSGVS